MGYWGRDVDNTSNLQTLQVTYRGPFVSVASSTIAVGDVTPCRPMLGSSRFSSHAALCFATPLYLTASPLFACMTQSASDGCSIPHRHLPYYCLGNVWPTSVHYLGTLLRCVPFSRPSPHSLLYSDPSSLDVGTFCPFPPAHRLSFA